MRSAIAYIEGIRNDFNRLYPRASKMAAQVILSRVGRHTRPISEEQLADVNDKIRLFFEVPHWSDPIDTLLRVATLLGKAKKHMHEYTTFMKQFSQCAWKVRIAYVNMLSNPI